MNKRRLILYLYLLCFLVFFFMTINSHKNDTIVDNKRYTEIENKTEEENKILKRSDSWKLKGKVLYIKDNWSDADTAYEWVRFANGRYWVENLSIDVFGDSYGILIEDSQTDSFTIKNCTIYNASSYGIRIENSGSGIIEDCYIFDNSIGVYIYNCIGAIVVQDCTIKDNSNYGVEMGISDFCSVLRCNISFCDVGISFWASNDINIIESNVSYNYDNGVEISGNNAWLEDNIINNNGDGDAFDDGGILHSGGLNNAIVNNDISYNEEGIYVSNANSYIGIVENNITFNDNTGISFVDGSWVTMINIKDNNVSNNGVRGMQLFYVYNATIDNNYIYDNGEKGIVVATDHNTTIKNNIIKDNDDYGIWHPHEFADWPRDNFFIINNTVSGNVMYNIFIEDFNDSVKYPGKFKYNRIIGSIVRDDRVTLNDPNSWDSNYYSYYSGVDANDDGIGDTPQNIYRQVGPAKVDSNPIWWDAPILTITSPTTDEWVNATPPAISYTVTRGVADTIWYMLDDGAVQSTNFNYIGKIEKNDWNQMSNGYVWITFYVNDSRGWVDSDTVRVRKNIIGPNISIFGVNNGDLFGYNAPDSVSIITNDVNGVDATWYMLKNATDNTHYTNNYTWQGSIEQSVWNLMDNGTVIIIFYANDTLGNIGSNQTIVRKDIIGPTIQITNLDSMDLFGNNPPTPTVIFDDINGVDATWYMLMNATDTTHYTNNFTWLGSIEQSVWNLMDNGTVIIIFYANDTLGNIGSNQIIVRKDIIAPKIVINTPHPYEVSGKITLDFDISINEANLNSTWYYLTDGFTQTGNITFIYLVDTTILQSIWNQVNGKLVTIYFFANDSMGNINFQTITVIKLADYWILDSIIIDDDVSNGAGDFNWTEATIYNWCNGTGTMNDPYIITNLYINGSGLGSCLTIRDTNKFFLIMNCCLFNSGNGDFNAGIKLINVNNGTITNNNCSSNYYGIILRNCSNNTISGNTINNNDVHGIALFNSSNNKILYNNETIDYNSFCGIFLNNSHFNNITGNYIRYNKIGICLNSSNYNTITYNHLIGNDEDIVQNNCIKNFIGNNYYGTIPYIEEDNGDGKDKGVSKEIFDIIAFLTNPIILLIIGLAIGIILVIIIIKRGGSSKKIKKERQKILEILK